MTTRVLHAALATLASLVLASCGGGGGDSGAGVSTSGGTPQPVVPQPAVPQPTVSQPTPQPTPQPVPTVPAVSVSGRVTYERINSNTNGSLNYSNITTLAARGVTVRLYSNDTFMAETTADANGNYIFANAPGNTTIKVRAFAELKKTSSAGGQWDVGVADNTQNGLVYALVSNSVSASSSPLQINLNAGSGWSAAANSYSGVRAAAPFAILDTMYSNIQKVLSVAPNAVFPVLNVYWSLNNTTAIGNISLGQIGVSYFQPTGTADGSITGRNLFLLGAANSDTDEYDESVISHEWGHYYQSAFSRDDSPGGSHGGSDDRLDRRLSFSEGWGNAWSGIALNNNSYKDSFGTSQAQGFTVPLNMGYLNSSIKGWFRERSMSYILWTLNQQVGFAPIHAALGSNAFRTGLATPDIYSFAAAFRSANPGTLTNSLNALLAAENINTSSDALGNNETNNGGSAVSLPFYKTIGSSLCASSQFDVNNAGNKIGRFVYVRFTTNAGLRIIAITSTAGADPDAEVYSSGKRVATGFAITPVVETMTVNLSAGEHLLVITDYNNTATPCFTVTVQ